MSGFRQLARRFQDLITQIDGADVRVPEDSALIGLAIDLVPTITRLLRQGIELLTDVEACYGSEEEGDGGVPDSLSQIGIRISMEFAARDLANVAFFARTDLRTAHEQLVSVATRKGRMMALATHCESSQRRLHKGLISVETAMYELEGEEPPEREWFDLEISLQIRKLYWNLRRKTSGHDIDPAKPLDVRLRSVLYRIVAFRELSVYPLLRVEDRVSLRQLLKRILEWLNGDERDPAAGERLWQDLSAFATILVHVSMRQELMEHDLELVAEAYRRLFLGGRQVYAVSNELAAEMQALLGLDDELDELILLGRQGPVEAWREPLRRLQNALSGSSFPAERLDLDL